MLEAAEELRRDVVPGDMELVVTRNSGLTADEKVNELVEGLWVAILIVVALLTLSLGWREALIVAVAVPVVFGLTLGVNLLFGFTINRVTLFALILSLGPAGRRPDRGRREHRPALRDARARPRAASCWRPSPRSGRR